MKSIIFAAITALALTLAAQEETGKTVDLFKLAGENGGQALYFKSAADPLLIKKDNKISILFKGIDFPGEKSSVNIPKKGIVKNITIKNYEGKGGAANILADKSFNAEVVRISDDVVKVQITASPATNIAPIEEKPAIKAAVVKEASKETAAVKEEPKEIAAVKEEPKKTIAPEEVKAVEKPVETAAASVTPAAAAIKENPGKYTPFDLEESGKEEGGASAGTKILAVTIIMLFGTGAFFFYRKKGKKDIFSKSGIMNIVESLSLGIKEKLVLLDVGGNYVLLFVKDKDVRELTMFSGDDADKIQNRIARKDFVPEETASVKPFKSRLEKLIEQEKQNRESTIESQVYSTINRLKALKSR